MKTKKFTLLQLFSIVDGRISTTVDDVQNILSHVHGRPILTNEIPKAIEELREAAPFWFTILDVEIRAIKHIHEKPVWYRSKKANFKRLMDIIAKEFDVEFDIPQLDSNTEK